MPDPAVAPAVAMKIHVGPTDTAPPFEPEALVFEQDADGVLRMDAAVRDPDAEADTLIEEMQDAPRLILGSVQTEGRDPVRLLAIVHDLEHEPSWQSEWVRDALVSVFDTVADREIQRVAMPLLGTVHGRMSSLDAVGCLKDAMSSCAQLPEELWLQVPAGDVEEVVEVLSRSQEEGRQDA